MYKDLYRIKDLFGGFQIQNLKKRIFLTLMSKKTISFHSTLYHVRARKKSDKTFHILYALKILVFLPTGTTQQRYNIYTVVQPPKFFPKYDNNIKI